MSSVDVAQESFELSMLWRDKRWRGVTIQVIVLALLFATFYFLIDNLLYNLEQLGKKPSFGFLSDPAMYDINMSFIDYNSSMSHGRAALVGLINTALIAFCGIVGATIVGFTLGVLRLSHNWLVRNVVYCFVEFTRNVPLLVQILLWHGIIINLPRVNLEPDQWLYVSSRGFNFPKPVFDPSAQIVGWLFLVMVVAAILFARWAKNVQVQTGKIYPVGWISLGLIIGVPLLVFLAMGAPVTFEFPQATRFNLRGGWRISPEFFALWLALTTYTAAFISETVRGGIMSVSKGQTEAASALGLKPNWTMRLVILPQALRVIVPPLTSQYLNLTKNSSLAIAIGYMDVTATLGNITISQTGRALEAILLVMAVYLSFSLLISVFMNWYNRRIKLVER